MRTILLSCAFLVLACKQSISNREPVKTADLIKSLMLLENHEEALKLFNAHLKNDQSYLPINDQLKLFALNDKPTEYLAAAERYYSILSDWKLDYTQKIFMPELANDLERLRVQAKNGKNKLNKANELIIKEFIAADQELRRSSSHLIPLDEKRRLDSINQSAIKSLLLSKSYLSTSLHTVITLLMRHASSSYVDEFKSSGLLDHYVSQGLYSREAYYSAYDYKNGSAFTLENLASNQHINKVNENRARVGLLPLELSPSQILLSKISMDEGRITERKRKELTLSILKYIDEY